MINLVRKQNTKINHFLVYCLESETKLIFFNLKVLPNKNVGEKIVLIFRPSHDLFRCIRIECKKYSYSGNLFPI